MGWTRQEVLDVARSTGQPVVEAWSNHNAGQMGTVVGPMLHHTGSAWSYPANKAPTLRTVREGRSDLQNALSMYYIDYEGVIYCITEKIAWHAGGGSWAGITDGNGHFAGIGAESDGQQWTKATVASYKRLAAAILRKTGRTVAYAPRHAEYALPKGRKTDFSGMDPAGFLADVNADLSGNTEGDDMFSDDDRMLLRDVQARLRGDTERPYDPIQLIEKLVTDVQYRVRGQHPAMDSLQVIQWQVSQIAAAAPGDVDEDKLAAALVAAIPDGIAEQVAQKLADRLAA